MGLVLIIEMAIPRVEKGISMKRRTILTAFFVLLLMVSTLPVFVLANGTETLGPANIPIATGSGIVAAGTGLFAQPGTIQINVPAGATVEQVLLYWECQTIGNVLGDATISIEGTDVTGTAVGGPAFFFTSGANDIFSSSFRADITSLGLVNPGANTLEITGLNCSFRNNGTGVLVIFDDGSGAAEIQLRDGVDLAFFQAPPPRNATVAQTYSFPSSTAARVATLSMFFGSVGENRPNSIQVTVNGTTTTLNNLLDSNDGLEWDTLNLAINIPAGASSLTVQAFSTPSTTPLGASLSWVVAGLAVPPALREGGEGCTPGYWKQKQHFDSWPSPYTPGTQFSSVFEDAFPGQTLLDVLKTGGGGLAALGRHTVAALLNAASSGVDYDFSVADVIDNFNRVFPGRRSAYNAVKDRFEDANEQGCPLD
jgi:hypothetical protein